jgi:hypothetical protein
MSTETTEQKAPTKEQVTKFYKEQIEIAKLRRDLSELLAETAKYDADRAESIARQAHFSAPKSQQPVNGELPDGIVQHTVTQEDMDNNPELAQQGIKVGDVIGISATPQVQEEPQTFVKEEDVEAQVRKLKKD